MKPLLTAVFVLALAVAAQAQSLILSWQDNSNNEDSFRIERGLCPTGPFLEIAVVGANVTTYVDAKLPPSTTFCYRLRAVNAAASSAYSDVAAGTTGPAPVPIVITTDVKTLIINTVAGQTFAPQTITVTVSNSGRFTTSDNSNFYSAGGPCWAGNVPLTPCASGTPFQLIASNAVSTLAPGTYSAPLTIRSPGAPDLVIPVTLIVSAAPPPVTITAPGGLVIKIGP